MKTILQFCHRTDADVKKYTAMKECPQNPHPGRHQQLSLMPQSFSALWEGWGDGTGLSLAWHSSALGTAVSSLPYAYKAEVHKWLILSREKLKLIARMKAKNGLRYWTPWEGKGFAKEACLAC